MKTLFVILCALLVMGCAQKPTPPYRIVAEANRAGDTLWIVQAIHSTPIGSSYVEWWDTQERFRTKREADSSYADLCRQDSINEAHAFRPVEEP